MPGCPGCDCAKVQEVQIELVTENGREELERRRQGDHVEARGGVAPLDVMVNALVLAIIRPSRRESVKLLLDLRDGFRREQVWKDYKAHLEVLKPLGG